MKKSLSKSVSVIAENMRTPEKVMCPTNGVFFSDSAQLHAQPYTQDFKREMEI